MIGARVIAGVIIRSGVGCFFLVGAVCVQMAGGCNTDPVVQKGGPAPPSSLEIEANLVYQQGQNQAAGGDHRSAAVSFARAASLAPGHVQARIALCDALFRTGQHQKAAASCTKALALAPGDRAVLEAVAAVYFNNRQHGLAIQPLRQAAIVAPRDTRLAQLLQTAEKGASAATGPANPATPPSSPGADRKQIWTTESFRCRAVSTTRFRKCRFEPEGNSYKLRFKRVDITCHEVLFDANGDPSVLKKCRANWLRIPSTNKLRSDPNKTAWSGSKRGWKWKGGGPYCCPGMWIQAPKSLQN